MAVYGRMENKSSTGLIRRASSWICPEIGLLCTQETRHPKYGVQNVNLGKGVEGVGGGG